MRLFVPSRIHPFPNYSYAYFMDKDCKVTCLFYNGLISPDSIISLERFKMYFKEIKWTLW